APGHGHVAGKFKHAGVCRHLRWRAFASQAGSTRIWPAYGAEAIHLRSAATDDAEHGVIGALATHKDAMTVQDSGTEQVRVRVYRPNERGEHVIDIERDTLL